ncbi:MAG: class I SAM-dependent methyltransferase [Alphaproteobacteria bacterium]
MDSELGVECPVCLAARTSSLTRANGLNVLGCRGCGTIFVHPLPSPAETRALYADAFAGATAGYFAKVETKMRRSRNRVRALRRLAPRGGRFLDVGCSGGFMVEAAREAGFAATGIDLEPPAIGYAREHFPQSAYFCGTIEEFSATSPDPFDVVYCSEVIEHVPDVRSFVGTIASLLRPGGVLYITTPNLTHWSQPRDLHRRSGFGPPAHCVYFTPRSLIGLLDGAGFDLVRRRLAFKPGIKLICRKRHDVT